MKKVIKILVGIIIASALVIGAVLSWFYFGVWKKPYLSDNEDKVLYIQTGSGFSDLLNTLYDWNTNADTTAFALIARQKKLHNKIKPGRYVVPSSFTMNDLINLLRSGNQTPVKVTFNHVNSREDLAGKIAQQIEPDSVSILREIKNANRSWPDKIDIQNNTSVFIPNTYEFYWNTSAKNWVERMIVEYHSFWNDERREKAKSIGLCPRRVSILASIVERETIKRDEMPKVAGLYLNRLQNDWKLQSDPTVIYAIQQSDPTFSPRRVLYEDLTFDSPFNTYLHKGLPPGPIGFPSITAIDAVLHPQSNDYFYMCANPDAPGYHSFARNNREHEYNKQRYVKWLQKQGIRR